MDKINESANLGYTQFGVHSHKQGLALVFCLSCGIMVKFNVKIFF